MNKSKLTTEQQELLVDFVEFFNTHNVYTISCGYKQKTISCGYKQKTISCGYKQKTTQWVEACIAFFLETDRYVSFYFNSKFVTPEFEREFLYLIKKAIDSDDEPLFPDPKKLNADRNEIWRAFAVGTL